MNRNLVKDYLKKSLKRVPVFLVIFLLLRYLVTDKEYLYMWVFIFMIDLIFGFFQYKKRQLYISNLEKNGLTEQYVINNQFITKWKVNRERGFLKYCLIDGGIILGAYLSILVSFTGLFILHIENETIFTRGPLEICQFIGISYLIGAFIGICLNWFIWPVNEKKFLRLTDQDH